MRDSFRFPSWIDPTIVGAPVPKECAPPQDGCVVPDEANFRESFAADLGPEKAAAWRISQVPFGLPAVPGTINDPA